MVMIIRNGRLVRYDPRDTARVTCPYCVAAFAYNDGGDRDRHQQEAEKDLRRHVQDVHRYSRPYGT